MHTEVPHSAPWSSVETLAWPEIQALQLALLQTQLQYLAARSVFYQRKFAAAGVTVATVATVAAVAATAAAVTAKKDDTPTTTTTTNSN